MLRKILIEGVRTHERTEIELGRLTCLVGPNGSGKTTVLQAVDSLRDDAAPHPSWQRAGIETWKIELEDSGGVSVRMGKGVEPDARPNVFWFRLDSEVLRQRSETGRTELGPQGHNLATVLANLKLSEENRFLEIVRQLQLVVPTLEDVRPRIMSLGDTPQFELLFDYRGARAISARAVSEGTLLSLGLLTAVGQLAGPKPIVLFDDIDRGLHPDAQVELINLIRKAAELRDFQVLMTTHSPFVVDALSPEEVYVLALDDTGTTRSRRLCEIPGAERYSGMLSTGELWSSHGESWVLEEQAKAKPSS